MTSLTKEAANNLEEYSNYQKKNLTKIRSFLNSKYTPAILENISQIRTTILSLSVTSAAIAAFSLNLFNNDLIKNKSLLLLSFLFFLLVTLLGYYYLKIILEKENNQLSQTTNEYNSAITKLGEAINNALEKKNSQSVEALLKEDANLNAIFHKNYEKKDIWFVRNIGDLMLAPFTLALLLIALSFLDFSQLANICRL